MEEKIKPCPFCESDNVKFKQTEKGACYVVCLDCLSRGSVAPRDEKEYVINKWNEVLR